MFTYNNKGVCAPKGFSASGIHCGIRKNKEKKDLALIYSEVPCVAASTYTQNKVKGAPIYVTQKHLHNDSAQAILCNSGNANTCNADGIQIADAMCHACGNALSIHQEDIIVASTGVIGQPLPLAPMLSGMPSLVENLQNDDSQAVCNAIMTTDTFIKHYALSFTLQGKTCHIGGIAKGSGMIHPNMATMLSFITSDVNISAPLLKKAMQEVVDDTFNMVSVDGDTSTNDMLSILCNGLAQNAIIEEENEDYETFKQAFYLVCEALSRQMASDGEGATKLLTCHVLQADDQSSAKAIAKSIITSSLFKSAMFGNDANWGRILCAIGYAPCTCDVQKINVSLASEKGSIQVCKDGFGLAFDEEKALSILQTKEVIITVDLQDGCAQATAWGCDLTYDYVKINGDYRT